MAPPVEKFVTRMRAMGIGDGHRVVVYDGAGMFSAPRVWWTLPALRQDRRRRARRRPAEVEGRGPPGRGRRRRSCATATSPPAATPGLVRDVTQVAATAKLGDAQIVDARAADRFRGEAPEPRPGLRSGHIPGSKNVPLARRSSTPTAR